MGFYAEIKSMKVCVLGLWHLGSVTAACLASVGHDVIGLDLDCEVTRNLSDGKAPIYEPGLDDLISKGIGNGKLHFTNEIQKACADIDVLWVTCDTPVNDDDEADVDHVFSLIKQVIPCIPDSVMVLISSQLPIGSVFHLEHNYLKEDIQRKRLSFAYSPENLRLGNAIEVFLNPDRIVVGFRSENDRKVLSALLTPVTGNIEWMSVESAEMTKHAINAFLATSVTFANELASICEFVNADAKEVERGLKTEARIGKRAYLSPGGAYAGGTLARDVEFLMKMSNIYELPVPLLNSVRTSNDLHKKWVQRKLLDSFPDLSSIQISVWGLTYKAGTDTLRRSLSVELVDWLIEQKVNVRVYDPAVKELPKNWFHKVKNCTTTIEGLNETQVLIVGTEWPEFKMAAHQLSGFANPNLLIIDANRFLLDSLVGTNFSYVSVGSKKINSN